MKFLLILFFGAISYIFYLIYQSFTFAKNISFFSFHISALGLVSILFGIFCLFFYYLFLSKRELFCTSQSIQEVFVLHLFFTLVLVYTGEYFYSLFLQFLFLMTLLRSMKIALYIYLLCIFIALSLLFVSHFSLYFLALLTTIYFIVKREMFFHLQEIQIFTIVSVCCGVFYFYAPELIFQIYIWSDIVDKVHFMSNELFFMLSVLQILTLTFVIKKYKDSYLLKKNENYWDIIDKNY